MARDWMRSVHRIPALAICLPALGLPIVQISHRRGSLIPLQLSERREADHTIQQAVDRTIYTPHTSFHRLHKPYLLHAPSVEPWTVDKHRPCQSPTGQRDIKAWDYCISAPCLFGRHRYALSLFFNQPLCEGIMRRSIFIAFVSHFSHRHVITLILLGRPFAIAFSFNINVPCKLVRFD